MEVYRGRQCLMEFYAAVWSSMEPKGGPMEPYGALQSPMEPQRVLPSPTEFQRALETPTESLGALWSPTEPYGALRSLTKPYRALRSPCETNALNSVGKSVTDEGGHASNPPQVQFCVTRIDRAH